MGPSTDIAAIGSFMVMAFSKRMTSCEASSGGQGWG
eukprot:CAMPEP_0174733414 /NCGR_PEP_ID=MMETSP1094-20130205/61279_1 /TAXON_ID=156173 /ORGANISM="Chrysochromulina brevifilum, Strain UTEX LB 985" /LENGTH=35 /DNA_ID= /DNA_START= /DNA_END= /DNA_ORIENTATION=